DGRLTGAAQPKNEHALIDQLTVLYEAKYFTAGMKSQTAAMLTHDVHGGAQTAHLALAIIVGAKYPGVNFAIRCRVYIDIQLRPFGHLYHDNIRVTFLARGIQVA